MGSKHDILTSEEMKTFSVNTFFANALDSYIEHNRLAPESCRVLDWGCGRGRLVAALLEQGFDAYGLDIDPLPIKNGSPYFVEMGHDPETRLKLWSPGEHPPFSDHSVDVLFSDQVIEHVNDLDKMAQEIARLLKPGGTSLHIWPAHRIITEPHLFMPFVHWLPKNRIRELYIGIMVRLGIEPRWPQLETKSLTEKTSVYYDYSVNKTYYRSPWLIRTIFLSHNLQPEIIGIGAPRSMIFNKALSKLGLLNRYTQSFITVGMQTA